MKRTLKIGIQRETLRVLAPEATQQVVGGYTNYKCTGDTVESHGPTCGRGFPCWFTETGGP